MATRLMSHTLRGAPHPPATCSAQTPRATPPLTHTPAGRPHHRRRPRARQQHSARGGPARGWRASCREQRLVTGCVCGHRRASSWAASCSASQGSSRASTAASKSASATSNAASPLARGPGGSSVNGVSHHGQTCEQVSPLSKTRRSWTSTSTRAPFPSSSSSSAPSGRPTPRPRPSEPARGEHAGRTFWRWASLHEHAPAHKTAVSRHARSG